MVNGYITVKLPVMDIMNAGADGLELTDGKKMYNDILKAKKPVLVEDEKLYPSFAGVTVSTYGDKSALFISLFGLIQVDASDGVSMAQIALDEDGKATAVITTYKVESEE